MIIVGNKCDLKNERCINYEEGKRLAQQWKIPFLEASAKSLHNVIEVHILVYVYLFTVL